MDGKVVVVTGASGALGKAVAEMALARGGKVASVDHAPSQIPPAPDRIELGGVDLSDAAQAKTAIDAAAAHFGRLNALINIAGAFAFETVANRASMPKADFSKWVTPEELAEVILFLASDAASAVTGALLPVSGRV